MLEDSVPTGPVYFQPLKDMTWIHDLTSKQGVEIMDPCHIFKGLKIHWAC